MSNILAPEGNTVSSHVRGPLRVIINGAHSKSGGGVTYLRNILPELAAMPDIELHIFLHKDQFGQFYPICENVNVILFSFQPTFFRTLIWEQLAIPLYAWGMGGEVVFSPANYGPIFGRNHVILLRNAVSVIRLTQRLGPTIYWLAVAAATFVSLLTAKKAIAVSDFAKKLLTFGFSRSLGKKCAVVHHGTHAVRSDKMHVAQSSTDLLAVSDIYIQKNYHTLLHAHAILIRKFPELRLIIVGREIDSTYAQSLRKLAQELGIEDNVVFKGFMETDELMKLYQNCRVFVFPSLIETFGNSLLEAMATGAPIACSNEAAMPEVLGDTGLFFDPKDKNDMADKIETLLLDNDLSVKLGEEASHRARLFSWRNTAEQTYAVLRDAAEPRLETPRRTR